MNAPLTIDALAVAQTIIADPHKRYTVGMLQIMAMCRALVDIAAQDDEPIHSVMAPLAVAVCKVINLTDAWKAAVEAALSDGTSWDRCTDARLQLNDALDALKIAFEKEFPHV